MGNLKNISKFILFYLTGLFFFGPSSWSQLAIQNNSESAVRLPGESFTQALTRNGYDTSSEVLSDSILNERQKYDDLDFSKLVEFQTVSELTEAFEYVRDLAFLKDPEFPGKSLRRSSWMYPDNGCWIRAELMKVNIETLVGQSLHKVFIFGQLNVQTPYSRSGSVGWWYHVVVIAKVQDTPYVFDPAIDASGPLTLKQWALKQVSDIDDASFSICHPDSYTPSRSCQNPTRKNIKTVRQDQNRFLVSERGRLNSLGVNVEDYLYLSPPWKVVTPPIL